MKQAIFRETKNVIFNDLAALWDQVSETQFLVAIPKNNPNKEIAFVNFCNGEYVYLRISKIQSKQSFDNLITYYDLFIVDMDQMFTAIDNLKD